MAELTVRHLRSLVSKESNRAAVAERQVRDLAAENARLRRYVDPVLVRDRAVALVDAHAARLGMDPFAALTLSRAIQAIDVEEEQKRK